VSFFLFLSSCCPSSFLCPVQFSFTTEDGETHSSTAAVLNREQRPHHLQSPRCFHQAPACQPEQPSATRGSSRGSRLNLLDLCCARQNKLEARHPHYDHHGREHRDVEGCGCDILVAKPRQYPPSLCSHSKHLGTHQPLSSLLFRPRYNRS
jgi:hypothetical protein